MAVKGRIMLNFVLEYKFTKSSKNHTLVSLLQIETWVIYVFQK